MILTCNFVKSAYYGARFLPLHMTIVYSSVANKTPSWDQPRIALKAVRYQKREKHILREMFWLEHLCGLVNS